MSNQQIEINNEADMLALGERISKTLAHQIVVDQQRVCIVYLRGDLGAGKTTLVKGVLKGLGYQGVVTSPTYTLVESYPLDQLNVFHFDLYRLKTADELEFLGLRDMLVAPVLVLVEWPENGTGVLPDAVYEIEIAPCGNGRKLSLPSKLLANPSSAIEMDH